MTYQEYKDHVIALTLRVNALNVISPIKNDFWYWLIGNGERSHAAILALTYNTKGIVIPSKKVTPVISQNVLRIVAMSDDLIVREVNLALRQMAIEKGL